jgi:succinyl-CoA synthetase alpha subunit
LAIEAAVPISIVTIIAGAILSGGKGDAESKIAAMQSAGIKVSPAPARIGKTLVEVLKS